MKVGLKVIHGSNAGRVVNIPVREFLIGRKDGCHLRPSSDLISRKHCMIKITDAGVIVRDLKSRNGTFINDELVQGERELKYGDRLKVGKLEFQILIDHGIGGTKKDKVKDVKEAAVRAATAPPPPATTKEEKAGDAVSSWLEEADEIDRERRINDPDTRQYKTEEEERVVLPKQADDTLSGASEEDTQVEQREKLKEKKEAEDEESKEEAEVKKKKAKKEPGKLPSMSGPQAKDSQDAASRVLKDFFNRR